MHHHLISIWAKTRHFHSLYLTNEHHFLLGGHLDFLNLNLIMVIQCVVNYLLHEQKNRHFYSFYITNEHHFLFGGHLELLNLKITMAIQCVINYLLYKQKSRQLYSFYIKTSITSCLAGILIFEIDKPYCILFVTAQNPQETFFNDILSFSELR